ncbi:hypothetical protein [Chitinophaga pinensis]|uniref:Uncharacterized protein n=1 Tax=Chitinophaga pinensis (strain ATCC 43595 / DSM 2588 / LMG 13176 / NBRC 15968 / NCIMB 11800 / UQM 2034) TaxID=485918 RepID=A0A979GSC1_CHIPD|nr:hypothetical protein [Chitinophaga pinensis]ACU61323.1 hypothetical protein Cpin_3861 [Chitinophaga pinensis DSM 2588]
MSNTSLGSINLNPDLLKPLVESEIKGALTRALGDPEKVVGAIVAQCLNQKVDDRGVVSNSSYDNKYNFMDIVFRNIIHAAAKEEMIKWASENTEVIRAAVIKEISSKKGVTSFAKAVVDGVVSCMQNTYKVSVEMKMASGEKERW